MYLFGLKAVMVPLEIESIRSFEPLTSASSSLWRGTSKIYNRLNYLIGSISSRVITALSHTNISEMSTAIQLALALIDSIFFCM